MEKYNFAITALQQRLMALENAYEKYVENGNCNKNSAVAKQNRKNYKDVKEAIETLQASENQSKLLLADVSKRFTDADVRNIVLEMQNAAMYALSNNLSRFETRIELQKVKRKWKT